MVGHKISPVMNDCIEETISSNSATQFHIECALNLQNRMATHNTCGHSQQHSPQNRNLIAQKASHNNSTPIKQPFQHSRMIGPYIIEKTLGKGTFGKVYLCTDPKFPDRQFAAKVIEKASVKTSREKKNVQRELRLMKILCHPNIIQVHDIYEEKDITLIIMEHASGGELHDYITLKKKLDDIESRKLFRQLISAVDYCHESSLVHRDLKPENLLLDSDKNIKLIDFGFGNTYSNGSLLNTFCGSPFYAAPEMTQGIEYIGPEVDIWSMGVILYMMLTGELPFMGTNIGELYDAIAKGQYKIPIGMDELAIDLLSKMLCVNPKHRICMNDIKEHRWVKFGYKNQVRNFVPERPQILPVLDNQVMLELGPLGYSRNDYVSAFKQLGKSPVKSLYHLHNERLQRIKPKLLDHRDTAASTETIQHLINNHFPSPPHSLSIMKPMPMNQIGILGGNDRGLVRPGSNSLNASPVAMNHPQPLTSTDAEIHDDSIHMNRLSLTFISNRTCKSTCSIVSIRHSFFGRARNAFMKATSMNNAIKSIYHALSSITRQQAHIVLSSTSLQLSGSLTNCSLTQQLKKSSFSCSKCRLTCKHHSKVVQHQYISGYEQECYGSNSNDPQVITISGGLMEYSIDLFIDEKRHGVLVQSKKLSGSHTDHKVLFQMLMNEASTFLNQNGMIDA